MTGCQRFRLGIIGQLALAVTIGAVATAQGQTTSDGSTAAPSRLPATVETVSYDAAAPDQAGGSDYALPYSPDVASRLQQLEAQLQEQRAMTASLQTQLQNPGPPPPAGNPPAQKRYIVGSDVTATGKFLSDGLTFSTANGDFKMHVGGLVNLDYIGIRNNNPGIVPGQNTQDSVEFRRLRVRMEGSMYENIDWISEVDLAQQLQNVDPANGSQAALGLRSIGTGTPGFNPGTGGQLTQSGNVLNAIAPTTVFMTFKNLPVAGNIRVGNQQDWIGMEHIESARFTDFMERAPIQDAYYGPNNNGYTPGISFFNNILNQNVNYMGGIYKNNEYDSGFTYNLGDHNWTYNLRGTWTPYYDEVSNGRYLVHLGFGTEYRTFNTTQSQGTGFDNIRMRSRGDLRNVAATIDPNFADTGNFYTSNQTLIDPEFAMQWGSLLVQAEWTSSFFGGAYTAQPGSPGSASLGKAAYTQGGYVQALYFLTGESRVYNRQSGVFVRTIPLQNAFYTRGTGCHGWGAWQLGIRYDWLDLNTTGGAANLNGGNEQDLTLGLNWFMNPNARFMINGVGSWVNNAAGVTAPGTLGALNGSRFTGDGTILSFGSRLDFTF